MSRPGEPPGHGAKGSELICDVASHRPANPVGDALRIHQPINHANNAVKFTERGEVGIGAASTQAHGGRC